MTGIAVIGAGMAAAPHARALRDLQEAGSLKVCGVWARDPERRAAFAERYSFAQYESFAAAAADPRADAALLLTPPNARIEFVEALAREGKHILMEKPVERTTDAAVRLVQLCEDARIKLGIVFQHRFREGSRRLASLIASGKLGELRLVQATVPWWREQDYYTEGRGSMERDGGGVLISQAIHTLDLMLSLAGPVESVQAIAGTTRFHQMECEDFAAGGLRFACKALGMVCATTASYPGASESLRFDFEHAAATLEAGTLTLNWRAGTAEEFGESSGTGGGADPMAFPHDWHRDLIADFADAVSKGREPAVTGGQALDVHRLIDAILESARTRKEVAVNG